MREGKVDKKKQKKKKKQLRQEATPEHHSLPLLITQASEVSSSQQLVHLWSPPLLYYSYLLLLPFPLQFSFFLSSQDLKPTWKSDTNLKCDGTLSLLLLLLLLLMLSKLMGLVFNLSLQYSPTHSLVEGFIYYILYNYNDTH